MRLRSLRLRDFRNISSLDLILGDGINFFLGDNGQGKTNVLEAVYLMSRGVSFRPTQASSYLRRTSGQNVVTAAISGVFAQENFDDRIEIRLEAAKRGFTLNGKRANSADLMRSVPVVLFSPESLAAIKEGPEQRRALADDLVLTQAPHRARLLAEHAKCLRSRNRVLRDLSKTAGDARSDRLTLESLDRIYLLLCAHLTSARIEALRAIENEFRDAMAFISDEDSGDISVDYLISEQSALSWSEDQVFAALQNRHRELASREIAFGASLVGPHKHDVKFLFRGNDSRFYCSQGQQRALILSFKIAQIVYHHRVHQTYPILLLDDVLSELDSRKRVGLMRFLDSVTAQILMTSTDLTRSEQLEILGIGAGDRGSVRERNSVFSVVAGAVERAPDIRNEHLEEVRV